MASSKDERLRYHLKNALVCNVFPEQARRWWYFAGLLFVVSATFSHLLHDEAYYWFYSQNLSWGYFDHPPLVGWLVALTGWLPQSWLAYLPVRLSFFVLQMGFFLALIALLRPKRPEAYFTLALAMPVFHVLWIVVPDAPLLFLVPVFLLVIRQFSRAETYANACLLAVVFALLMYSKYHGILIILFGLLPHIRWVRLRQFWFAVGLSLLLYAPHLYWLHSNKWVTVAYQLQGRFEGREWSWLFVLEYLGGFLALVGGVLLVVPRLKTILQGVEPWKRSARFITFGFFIFFLLQSLRGKIELNWIFPAAITFFCLIYPHAERVWDQRRFLRRTARSATFLLCGAHIALLPPLNDRFILSAEASGWQKWANEVHSYAGDKPVLFVNSYAKAAKYSYYTGKEAYSYNNMNYGGNHYDLLGYEQKISGQQVVIVHNAPAPFVADFIRFHDRNYYLGKIENFRAYNAIELSANIPALHQISDTVSVVVTMHNLLDNPVTFEGSGNRMVSLGYAFWREGLGYYNNRFYSAYALENKVLATTDSISIDVIMPAEADAYEVWIFVMQEDLPQGRLGAKIPISVSAR